MLVEVERAMSAIIALPRCHRITVAEYHRMGGAGIFGEDDHVELLEGELFDMVPIGSLHANAVARLVHLFFPARDKAVLWVQNPIALSDSEPQPDLALLEVTNYADHLPTAERSVVADRSRRQFGAIRPGPEDPPVRALRYRRNLAGRPEGPTGEDLPGT